MGRSARGPPVSLVGLGAVALSTLIGLVVGLLAGFFGGITDTVLMRVAEVQFAFPPILIALLLNGILKTALPADVFATAAVPIMISRMAGSRKRKCDTVKTA